MITQFTIITLGVVFFHWLDMFFTVLLIQAHNKYFDNSEDLELNFHRYFFRKFGVVKGACFSVIISTIVMLFASFFVGYPNNMIILGINIAMAYTNFMTWQDRDKLIDKLKEIKRSKV